MIQVDVSRIDKLIYHRLFEAAETDPEWNDQPHLLENGSEEEVFKKVFLKPFTQLAVTHEFTHPVSLDLNVLHNLCNRFEKGSDFTQISKLIVKHLNDVSRHPAIPGGDVFIVSYHDIHLGNAVYDGIGIYKIERKDFFIETAEIVTGTPGLRIRQGIGGKRFDKAVLVLFTEDEAGTLLVMEKPGGETDYWQRDFIGLTPKKDNINHTNAVLNLTKNFVTEQYPAEFEVNKADQIDLLNRSVAFFKNKETFDKREFEQEVLQDAEVIKSFHQFNQAYSEEVNWELADQFEISAQAVKKQQRIFKSVLKLDKNFHVYIHGDRNLIERGADPDGRKYYKIYFENEA
jgi:hypothetical protein